MATIQNQIAEKFLAKLHESGEVDEGKVELLRKLLLQDKKIKAEDLVKIFSHPSEGKPQ
jgi:sulfate adenylyltransferase subunit 1 (EFTu-like GTPase family)